MFYNKYKNLVKAVFGIDKGFPEITGRSVTYNRFGGESITWRRDDGVIGALLERIAALETRVMLLESRSMTITAGNSTTQSIGGAGTFNVRESIKSKAKAK